MDLPLSSAYMIGQVLFIFDILDFDPHNSMRCAYEYSSFRNTDPLRVPKTK
jgi:hypothetical protein